MNARYVSNKYNNKARCQVHVYLVPTCQWHINNKRIGTGTMWTFVYMEMVICTCVVPKQTQILLLGLFLQDLLIFYQAFGVNFTAAVGVFFLLEGRALLLGTALLWSWYMYACNTAYRFTKKDKCYKIYFLCSSLWRHLYRRRRDDPFPRLPWQLWEQSSLRLHHHCWWPEVYSSNVRPEPFPHSR